MNGQPVPADDPMPPMGHACQAAFDELTALGCVIKQQLGHDWNEVFLTFQGEFWRLVEQYEPGRLAQ